MKILNKIRNIMINRNGIDELNIFLIYIYLILLTINIFTNNIIIKILMLTFALLILYRSLSKNINREYKINKKYKKIKNKITSIPLNIKNKLFPVYIYKKCKKCKTKLRLPLPNKIGIKKVICPSCKHKNKYIILKRKTSKNK